MSKREHKPLSAVMIPTSVPPPKAPLDLEAVGRIEAARHNAPVTSRRAKPKLTATEEPQHRHSFDCPRSLFFEFKGKAGARGITLRDVLVQAIEAKVKEWK